MTSDLDTSPRHSQGDRARTVAYLREFGPTMAAYTVAIGAVALWGDLDGDSPWRFAWALLPVVPVLLLVRVVVRSLRRSDEYARLLQLTNLAVAFAATVVACVVLGMLAIADVGLPSAVLAFLPVYVGTVGWAVAAAVTARR